MAIAFRDSATGIWAGVIQSTFTVTIPSTVQVGDGALLFFCIGAYTTAPTWPTGWVQAGLVLTSAGSVAHVCLKKVIGSGDASSTLTVTYGGADKSKQGASLVVYSGTDTSDPVNVINTRTETVSQQTHTMPTVTTSVDQAWIIQAITDKDTVATTSWAASAGLTRRVQAFATGGGQSTSAVADDNSGHAVSGTYGGGTWTSDVGSNANVVTWTVALAPKVSVQTGRPTTDITFSGWSGTPSVSPLATDIGEVTRDDTTFITSPVNPTSSVFETRLNSLVDPVSHTGYQVFYVLSTSGSPSTSSTQVDVVENATIRATWTETAIPSVATLYVHTMTDPQCASITDYTNLRLRFTATAS